jgi:hypothetical protein
MRRLCYYSPLCERRLAGVAGPLIQNGWDVGFKYERSETLSPCWPCARRGFRQLHGEASFVNWIGEMRFVNCHAGCLGFIIRNQRVIPTTGSEQRARTTYRFLRLSFSNRVAGRSVTNEKGCKLGKTCGLFFAEAIRLRGSVGWGAG